MPTHTWTINLRDMDKRYINGKKAWDKLNLLREIDRRFYFEGFNVGKEKKMFQEELNDLELVYKSTLVKLQKQVEDCLPSLLHYMEEFINLHKQNEGVREKLDTLLAKTGRKPETDDDECEGGCDD